MGDGEGGALVSLRLAVVYEAPADFQTATELADRALVEAIDWMEDQLLDHQRTWIREWSGAPLTWKRIKWSAIHAGFNLRGLYDEEPAKPDARAAHRAVVYLSYSIPRAYAPLFPAFLRVFHGNYVVII
jgi:hypothetical protein